MILETKFNLQKEEMAFDYSYLDVCVDGVEELAIIQA